MKQLYPDLWQMPVETRFGTLQAHAYLLELKGGNALFYHAENPETLQTLKPRGVRFQYLSHNHEIAPSLETSRETLGAKLCGHVRMQPYFKTGPGLDIAFETQDRETLPGGLEVIFTPGHTDNNVCYRYASPHGRTYLFTGDTIYQEQGEWHTLVMKSDGGDARDLAHSLQRLRALDVDVLICSVAIGETRIAEVTRPEWETITDRLAGELHAH